MTIYRWLFAFDAVTAIALGAIFCFGLADSISAGHVDRDDLLLWPPLIVGVAAVLGGGWWLKSHGRRQAAIVVLSVVAVPGLLAVLAVLYLITQAMRPHAFG